MWTDYEARISQSVQSTSEHPLPQWGVNSTVFGKQQFDSIQLPLAAALPEGTVVLPGRSSFLPGPSHYLRCATCVTPAYWDPPIRRLGSSQW
jgi:hypothetical protein